MKQIRSYIPNTITLLNLLCGCIAVTLSFHSDTVFDTLTGQQWACIFIATAAVFDFCDGLSARLLGAYSPLGKELDSLSDLVSFGLAPAFLVMNLMRLNDSPVALTLIPIFIALMGALRLAKFNIDTRQTTSFIGLPIPANAIFWIGVIGWTRVHGYPGDWVIIPLVIVIALLMVSEIKMFSLKFHDLSFRSNVRRYVIIAATILFVITDGVAGLAWTIVLYILISLLGKKANA
ncbi:MAG: CDP-diacylglycerol--serine O-phosphatidyltransferase [Bacteroides sp.]|nr:CDP-diacylglycerol--serine O-phosphatidyltransferase [Bacteroides sp.]